jgi:predicted Zn-dependent protease
MSTARPQDLADRACELAGGDGCIAVVRESGSVNLRWAGNTLTTNGQTRGRSVTVIAAVDGAQGTATGAASGSNVSLEEVADLVAAARRDARAAGPAEDARPLVTSADLAALAQAGGIDGADWSREPEVTTSAVLAGFAPALGRAFERARAQGRELFGFAEHDVTTTYLATSTGLRLRHAQPTGRVEVTGKSHDRSRSTFTNRTTRDFTDVDVDELDAEIATRLAWSDRIVELGPGRYDTILPPNAVADMMIYLYWSASAREAYDGRTVFSRPGGGTRVGDRLSDVPVELWSDPSDHRIGCEPFVVATASGPASSVFDNGLPLGRTSWIRDGGLESLLQTRASAELTALPVTPAVDNLMMSVPGASGDLADLVAGTSGQALLLTCLWYIRAVDPQTLLLTGLTRDGVHVVRDGEVVGTATNFRFNESPVDLLGRVRAASESTPCLAREWGDYFTRTAMPALLVDGFNMSTVSPAS